MEDLKGQAQSIRFIKKTEKVEYKNSVIAAFKELGIDLTPPSTIGIYGLPLVGKSLLSWLLAKELGQATIYAIEEQYSNLEYIALLNKIVHGSEVIVERVYDLRTLVMKLKKPRATKLIIIDSLSALADAEASNLIEKGINDISILSARLNPLMRIVASLLNRACNINKSIGLIITHASSMAGRGLYRDIVPFKPSFSGRCLHYLTHLLYVERKSEKADIIKITLVTSRIRPYLKGRSVMLKLRLESDVQCTERQK